MKMLVSEGHYGDDPMHAPALHSAATHEHRIDPSIRPHVFPASLSTSKPHLGCGKPFSSQTVGPVSGAPCQAKTNDQCNPSGSRLALSLVRLASGLGCGATGDIAPLAS